MGVSHGYQRYLPFLPVAGVCLFQYAVVFRVGREGGGNGGTVEDGFAHVDGDGVVRVHYGDDGTGKCVDSIRFSCCEANRMSYHVSGGVIWRINGEQFVNH